jgi:hypothetical protein
MRCEMGEIYLLSTGIYDQHQRSILIRIRRPSDHKIVDNAAILGKKLRIALLTGAKIQKISWGKGLQCPRRCLVIRADQKGLPHMGDVKQSGMGSRPLMFC